MANILKSIRSAKLKCKPIEVPQWPLVDDDGAPILKADGTPDCTYYARVLSIQQLIDLQAANEADPDNSWWTVISQTLCNEDGELSLKSEDRESLSTADQAAIQSIVNEAQQINGLGDSAKNS